MCGVGWWFYAGCDREFRAVRIVMKGWRIGGKEVLCCERGIEVIVRIGM